MAKKILFSLFIFAIGCVQVDKGTFPDVKHEEGKIYIVDRTAQRWDITQALSLGFRPERFQYGIGKNAFTPLDDSFLTESSADLPEKMRIIGIEEGLDARAYSVRRLRRHEISNSALGDKPVAVGY